jgi:ribonuclease HII
MKFLLGVDEAGRGPLAGPVAVGFVMAPEGFDIAKEFPGVADSKQLSEKKREKLFTMLEDRAKAGDVQFCVEFGSHTDIDEKGIASVIRDCIARGIRNVGYGVSHMENREIIRVLLDGGLKAPEEYEQETIIRGDATVPIISLASIAAKVTRDRLMLQLAEEYPEYGFARHKGYGTALHYESLKKHGPCAIHRRSFLHLAD